MNSVLIPTLMLVQIMGISDLAEEVKNLNIFKLMLLKAPNEVPIAF